MIDAYKTGARIKQICLNFLLEGTACLFDCFDNRFMHKLTGWRCVRLHANAGWMPMHLPNADSCTAWVSGSRYESESVAPISRERAQISLTSPATNSHALAGTEVNAAGQ